MVTAAPDAIDWFEREQRLFARLEKARAERARSEAGGQNHGSRNRTRKRTMSGAGPWQEEGWVARLLTAWSFANLGHERRRLVAEHACGEAQAAIAANVKRCDCCEREFAFIFVAVWPLQCE